MTSEQFARIQSRTVGMVRNRINASQNGWPRDMKQYWVNVKTLCQDRQNATKQSLSLIVSKDIAERYYAASLIGILVNPIESREQAEARQVLRAVCDRIEYESDPRVLTECAVALGYDGFPFVCDYLIRLTKHPDETVCFEATRSLSNVTGYAGPRERVIKQLIKLSSDEDQDVRNWATFGLAQHAYAYYKGSKKLDDALLARLNDRFFDARDEAIQGLALRKDARGVAALSKRLNMVSLTNLNIKSAATYGLPAFYNRLVEIRSWSAKQDDNLDWALQRCNPSEKIRIQADQPWEWDN